MKRIVVLLGVCLLFVSSARSQLGATFNSPITIGVGELFAAGNILITPTGDVQVYGTLTSSTTLVIQSGGKLTVYSGATVASQTLDVELGGYKDVQLGANFSVSGNNVSDPEKGDVESADLRKGLLSVETVLVTDKVYGVQGAIRVEFDSKKEVGIYTPAGTFVQQVTVKGVKEIPLSAGLYIVKAGTVSHKVVVH
ncbi:MAG: hypothetical protein LBU03_05625 [Tannerellaceae bacterium]|jgi:hypothetical protein|nr:hypothetical protein [Tannerellaceae bacterium]